MGRPADWIYDLLTQGRVNLLRLPQAPSLGLDDAARHEFDAMLEATPAGGRLDYRSARPKHEFLRYLAEERDLVLHGSNDPEIREFTPRPQHTYTGEPVEAVFATADGIWVLYFATVARPPVRSLRNACNVLGDRRRYFFSIDTDPASPESWTNGAVYILERDSFTSTYDQEWVSRTPVLPRARLAVTPVDFPFRRRVFRHRVGESDAAFLTRLARAGARA